MKTVVGKIVIKIASTLLILLALVYLYTLLHEGGHALVAVMYGGKIDNFVLGFNAHVTYSEVNYTQFGKSLSSSAGVLLPAISLAIALLFYNRNNKHSIYHYIYAGISIAIISSFLAWEAIPLISLFTAPPVGDDVTNFLEVSGLYPLAVSLVALLLMFLLGFLAFKKGLFVKIAESIKALSQAERTKLNKLQRLSLVLAIVLLGSVAFACYQFLHTDKVFKTSFSMNVYDAREGVDMPFTVEKSKSYNMDLVLEAEGMLTDVQIYDDKGATVYQNTCEWFTLTSFLELKKGNYRFVLTFLRDPETMQQYFKEKEYTFSKEQIDMLNELFITHINDEYIPVSFSAIIK